MDTAFTRSLFLINTGRSSGLLHFRQPSRLLQGSGLEGSKATGAYSSGDCSGLSNQLESPDSRFNCILFNADPYWISKIKENWTSL